MLPASVPIDAFDFDRIQRTANKKGAMEERARVRAKVEEMLAKADFTEELDKLLRWLDGEDA